jgi:UDP-3-O-[3-hydroxymyristoyl] glucosamine N-acyltransferase
VSLRLGQIVEALGGALHGSPDVSIDRLAPLDTASAQSLSFLSNPRYVSQLSTTQAACVIVGPAHIGANSWLKSRVTLGEGCSVGARCILHSGVVIGADGFGFAPDAGTWVKIEQLGAVRIGDDVEIGANSCIDRGALDDTVLENGVKLDNLVQIGHNVHVGAHTAMAGCVGVAGSARIGAHCTVGGGAVVLGHLSLADHVHVSAASVVMRSILQPGHYSGVFPIDDNASWEKNAATLRQLHRLRDRIRALEQALTGPPT